MSEILYHYAKTETFHKIISLGKFRLSALTLSNDAMEGKWVQRVLRDMCKKKAVQEHHIARLIGSFNSIENISLGLGFCLSEAKDLLSQWRGYADDGTGFCIGLDKELLIELCIEAKSKDFISPRLAKVIYSLDEQEALIQEKLEKLLECLKGGAFDFSPREIDALLADIQEDGVASSIEWDATKLDVFAQMVATNVSLLNDLYKVKNPAFREEAEWRVYSVDLRVENDIGRNMEIQFHPMRNKLVPFFEIDFAQCKSGLIKEVVVGPRNVTPLPFLKSFMLKSGCHDVSIAQSDSTYRQ